MPFGNSSSKSPYSFADLEALASLSAPKKKKKKGKYEDDWLIVDLLEGAVDAGKHFFPAMLDLGKQIGSGAKSDFGRFMQDGPSVLLDRQSELNRIGSDLIQGTTKPLSYRYDPAWESTKALFTDEDFSLEGYKTTGKRMREDPFGSLLDVASLVPGVGAAARGGAIGANAGLLGARAAKIGGHVPNTPEAMTALRNASMSEPRLRSYAGKDYVPGIRTLSKNGIITAPKIRNPNPITRGRQGVTGKIIETLPMSTPLVGVGRTVGRDLGNKANRRASGQTERHLAPFVQMTRRLNEAQRKAWYLKQQSVDHAEYVQMLRAERHRTPDAAEAAKLDARIKEFDRDDVRKAMQGDYRVDQAVAKGKKLGDAMNEVLERSGLMTKAAQAEREWLAVRLTKGARFSKGEPGVLVEHPDNPKHAREYERLKAQRDRGIAYKQEQAEILRRDADRVDAKTTAQQVAQQGRIAQALARRADALQNPKRNPKARPRTREEALQRLDAALKLKRTKANQAWMKVLRDDLADLIKLSPEERLQKSKLASSIRAGNGLASVKSVGARKNAQNEILEHLRLYAEGSDEVIPIEHPMYGAVDGFEIGPAERQAMFAGTAKLSRAQAKDIIDAWDDADILERAFKDEPAAALGILDEPISYGELRPGEALRVDPRSPDARARKMAAKALRGEAWKLAAAATGRVARDTPGGVALRNNAARLERVAERHAGKETGRMRTAQARASRVVPDDTPGIYGFDAEDAMALGRPEPGYVPHKPITDGKGAGGGVSGEPFNGVKRVPGSNLKENTGHLFTKGIDEWDPSTLARSGEQVFRRDDVVYRVEEMFDLAPERPISEVPPNWIILDESGAPNLSGLASELRGHLEHYRGILPEDEYGAMVKYLSVFTAKRLGDPDAMVRAVPPGLYHQVMGDLKATNKWVKNLIDRPTDVFRFVVLPLRPAWYVANAVGNAILYGLSAKGPGAVKALAVSMHMQGSKSNRWMQGWVTRTAKAPEYIAAWENALERAAGLKSSSFGRSELTTLRGAPARKRRTRIVRRILDTPQALGDLNAFLTDDLFRQARFIELMQKEVKLAKRQRLYPEAKHDGDIATALLDENPKLQERITQQVLDDLIDFRNLSPAERRVVRRIVPFYSWSKGMTQWSTRWFWERPQAVWASNAITDRYEDDNKEWLASLPSFAQGTLKLGKGRDGTTRGWNTASLNPFSTTADMFSLMLDGRKRGDLLTEGGGLGSMFNPILKAPLEAINGQRDWFTGMPIVRPFTTFDFDKPLKNTASNPLSAAAYQLAKAAIPSIAVNYEARNDKRHGIYNSPFSDYAKSYMGFNVRNLNMDAARKGREEEDAPPAWDWRMQYG